MIVEAARVVEGKFVRGGELIDHEGKDSRLEGFLDRKVRMVPSRCVRSCAIEAGIVTST